MTQIKNDPEPFEVRFRRLKRGQSIVYHTGLLMRDRQYSPDKYNADANAAWAAHERGDAVLLQRRIPFDGCQYIAVRV